MVCLRCGCPLDEPPCEVCGWSIEEHGVAERELYLNVHFETQHGVEPPMEALPPRSLYHGEESRGDRVLHHSTFDLERAPDLTSLVRQLGDDFHLTFNGRKRPLDRELWLPLLWFLG